MSAGQGGRVARGLGGAAKHAATAALLVFASAALVSAMLSPRSPAGSRAATVRGVVDLNSATPGQLEALPRIGPALAARIVEDRERNGAFARVEDLDRVQGIGARTIEAIRAYVEVR